MRRSQDDVRLELRFVVWNSAAEMGSSMSMLHRLVDQASGLMQHQQVHNSSSNDGLVAQRVFQSCTWCDLSKRTTKQRKGLYDL